MHDIIPKLTIARLLASGAYVGVAVGHILGLDARFDLASGFAGAISAAVALKVTRAF